MALLFLGRRKKGKGSAIEERSTTSSAGGGAAAYETRKAVDEYLQFHFGADSDILPYANGPKVRPLDVTTSRHRIPHATVPVLLSPLAMQIANSPSPLRLDAMHPQEALRFPARCAQLCEKHCKALRDFTGEGGETLALDVGCAVGGAAFELARVFDNVLGIDYSQAFVDAAKVRRDLPPGIATSSREVTSPTCKRSGFRRSPSRIAPMQHCLLAFLPMSLSIPLP